MSVKEPTHNDSELDDSELDDRVVAAVKKYMALLDSGNAPGMQDFLQQHADIADQLSPAINGLALVHRAAERKPATVAEAPDVEFTSKPIGDFQIIGELGRGGMGVVYEAIQMSLGRRVALKVLPFASSLDDVRLQRFRNEAHAAAALHHTNIVPVYAVGSDRGVHFYAMQLIDGQTLADVIEQMRESNGMPIKGAQSTKLDVTMAMGDDKKKTPTQSTSGGSTLPQRKRRADSVSTVLTHSVAERTRYYRTVVKMVYQAAIAIQHAHQYGVIHRDIKPGNLLLDSAGQIWVTDFGLAQIQHADSNMTRTGDPMGTLKYMSPEQAVGNRAEMDHRTDIYSLGITLYELLTLEPAIKGDGYRQMLNQVAEHDPPSPKSLAPALPIELDTIVRKAISKAPADRYSSAQLFAEDLQSWMEDKPIAAKPPSIFERIAKWRRRNSGVVAMASMVLMAATLGLLITTLVIYRALDRETQQRELAEESFQQAKSAVDEFSSLSESELAFRPDLQDLRRNFLETSLAFYQEFLELRSEDSRVASELVATSARVQKMVEELRLLENIEPLLLLSNRAIQEDLGIDHDVAVTVEQALNAFQFQRSELANQFVGSLQTDNSEMSDLLIAFEKSISSELNSDQLTRLHQIARQQRLPFVFKTSEVASKLGLSREQRESINHIIEETRPGRGGGDRHQEGPRRPEFDRRGAPPRDFSFGPPPERFNSPDFRGGEGPPRHDFGGPFRGNGFSMARSEVTQNTVNHILEILTPKQLEKWTQLIGKPFNEH